MTVRRPPASAIPGLRAGKPRGKAFDRGTGIKGGPPKPMGGPTKPVATKKAPAWTKRAVVPGSSMTLGALNRAANAAVKTQYGPLETSQRQAVGQAKTYAADVGGPGGFYDQYLKALARHSANVGTIAEQANTAVGALPGQVTGLAAADLSSLQGQANAGAAARGMGPAGDLAPMASNAAAVRQALTGSFAAQQAAQNAAAQNYSDTLARVVAPQEKLAGQAVAAGKIRTAGEKLTETQREKGAAKFKYVEETKASEAKNVLAQQIASGNIAAKLATATKTASTKYGPGGSGLNKYGYTAKEWASLSPAERTKARAGRGRPGGRGTDLGKVNQYGYSDAQWRAMSVSQRQAIIRSFKKGGSSGGGGGGGLTRNEQNQALTQVSEAADLMRLARQGKPFAGQERPDWKNKPQPQDYAMRRIRTAMKGRLKNPWLVNAAGDATYTGHLWGNTERNLKAQGYSPNEIAAALGTKTMAQWQRDTPAGRQWTAINRRGVSTGASGRHLS